MLWVLTLIGQIAFGFELGVFLLTSNYDYHVLIGFSIPLGFGISSLLFFVTGALLGLTSIHVIAHTIFLYFASYVLYFRRSQKGETVGVRPTREIGFFFLVSILLSFLLVPKMYVPKPRTFHSAFLGDIQEEVALIQSFYHGVNSGIVNLFKIRNPECYRCIVKSRWLTAFHSAILRVGFASLHNSLIVPSMFLFFALCFLFLILASRFLNSTVWSFAALFVFLLNGGLGFFKWLEPSVRHNQQTDFVFAIGPGHTGWSHPLYHYLFAHRPSQFSCAVIFSIFLLLSRLEQINAREAAVLGIFVGLLPSLQSQVWIMTVAYLAVFLALNPGLISKRLLVSLVSFGIVALVQLFHYFPRACFAPERSSVPIWSALARSGEYFPVFEYWFECLGFFPILAFFVAWFFMGRRLLRFYIPSVVVCCYVSFHQLQPYPRQTVLVFFPLWLSLASIAVMKTFKRWSNNKNEEVAGVLLGISIALFLSFVFSALLGLVRLFNDSREMWTPAEDGLARWVVKSTPRKAVFIACDGMFSPVFALAGKVQLLHDTHMAWVMGYQTEGREQEMERLLENPRDPAIAPKVAYVVNHAKKCPKRQLRNESTSGWEAVFQTGEYTVYKRPS